MPRTTLFTLTFAIAILAAGAASAGEAVCYNTDEGEYDCWFEPHEGGSFTISAEGYTTYYVDVTEPGVAWAVATFPGEADGVSLPGPYYREREQPACWRNPDTSHEICAW
jgi:hypothetical protein